MALAMPFFMDRKTARSSESCNMLQTTFFACPNRSLCHVIQGNSMIFIKIMPMLKL
ncbi:hypothetical protein HMPREF3156_02652 [Neisseria sp. HMSC06F02]|nr:hypothetical protein HMPREF3156_02652 [Neisseria sp. HMSC06F02]